MPANVVSFAFFPSLLKALSNKITTPTRGPSWFEFILSYQSAIISPFLKIVYKRMREPGASKRWKTEGQAMEGLEWGRKETVVLKTYSTTSDWRKLSEYQNQAKRNSSI